MKKLSQLFLVAIVLSFSRGEALLAQGTAFTYQGRLINQGIRANGFYDFQFTLHDAVTGGNEIGVTLTNSSTLVTNGLFTLTLDFGEGAFTGPARWLEMGERTNGEGSFTILSPRQAITATPYTIMANSASNLLGTLSASQITGNLPSTQLSGTISLAQLPDGVLLNHATGVILTGAFSGNGAGLTNLTPASVKGTLIASQIPNLDASKITTGVFTGNGAGLTKVPGAFLWQVAEGGVQAASNNGYLATNNNAQAIINLPASPNPGDVVRVSGSGYGGWKISQNSGQSILAGNFRGSFGVLWTPQNSTSQSWWSMSSSADGTKLAAAGKVGQIYISSDSGFTWTTRAPGAGWAGVACSTDGAKLVAAPNSGKVFTSSDSGTNWTVQNTPTRNWYAVASSGDGSKLLAAGDDPLRPQVGAVYISTDSGTNWTARAPSLGWRCLASSADGTKLFAAGDFTQIYTSTDSGVNWTARGPKAVWYSLASSADGTRIVAAAWYGGLYTSSDSGTTWTLRVGTQYWSRVASSADGARLVAAINRGQIYISTDFGATWTPRAGSQDWFAVASSADGTKLAAGVFGGQIYTSQLTPVSNTTVSTGSLVGAQYSSVELQYVGNGLFMPLSYLGTIYGL